MKLRELALKDLYVSQRGACRMREVGNKTGLKAVPPAMLGDVQEMLAAIEKRAAERKASEFSIVFQDVPYRIARIDSVGGVWWMANRVWERPKTMLELGFPRKLRDTILEIGRDSGIILLTGPAGSGKTTSAYGILYDLLLATNEVAICIEDPPEMPLDGPVGSGWCFQIEIRDDEWGEAMRHALRHRPRFIFLGEIRTREAAHQALRAAVNGHLVLTTLHAGGAIESLDSLLGLFDPSERRETFQQLAEGLLMVINQRLFGVGATLRPQHEILLAAKDFGVKAKIRAGKFEMLSTEVENHTRKYAR